MGHVLLESCWPVDGGCVWHFLVSPHFRGVLQMVKGEVNFFCRWNRMGEKNGDNSVKEVGGNGENVL